MQLNISEHVAAHVDGLWLLAHVHHWDNLIVSGKTFQRNCSAGIKRRRRHAESKSSKSPDHITHRYHPVVIDKLWICAMHMTRQQLSKFSLLHPSNPFLTLSATDWIRQNSLRTPRGLNRRTKKDELLCLSQFYNFVLQFLTIRKCCVQLSNKTTQTTAKWKATNQLQTTNQNYFLWQLNLDLLITQCTTYFECFKNLAHYMVWMSYIYTMCLY